LEHVGVGGFVGVLMVDEEENIEDMDNTVEGTELGLCCLTGMEDLVITV
jgi:hypothetical protein